MLVRHGKLGGIGPHSSPKRGKAELMFGAMVVRGRDVGSTAAGAARTARKLWGWRRRSIRRMTNSILTDARA